MITRLEVSGLALIEKVSVNWSSGLNVITGETGAGKSILIRALNLLQGNRASAELIRSGEESAVVTGVFEVDENHAVMSILSSLGFSPSTEVVLRRTISSGKSLAWINDVSVSTTSLKMVAASLIDIFSQFENQRLMDSSTHVTYLDKLGNHAKLVSLCQQSVGKLEKILVEIEKCFIRLESKNVEFLRYQLEELEKLSPDELDYENLVLSVKSREQVMASMGVVNDVTCLLESEEGALVLLRKISQAISKVHRNLSAELPEKIEDLISSLNQFSFSVGKLGEPEIGELEKDQARLFKYQESIRKWGGSSGGSIGTLLSEFEKLKEECRLQETAVMRLTTLIEELDLEINNWEVVAKQLTASRQLTSEKVCRSICKELSELAMVGSRFEVGFKENVLKPKVFPDAPKDLAGIWEKALNRLGQVSRLGAETVEFLLGANPGEVALPLGKIASGGELSRIMLALKSVLMSGADTVVMVFDEIDSGISGRVADIVGKKIKKLSKDHQVLCISHLPQVCAYADTHLLVSKRLKNKRTETSIEELSQKGSTDEIARMLSGEKLSASSLSNAQILISRARSRETQKNLLS